MKTKRYTPGWTLSIIVASLMGMVAWYGLGRWMEPKPLWIKSYSPAQRQYHPTSYDPDRKLLAMFEYQDHQIYPASLEDTILMVVDTRTGATMARLSVGNIRIQGIQRHMSSYYPHIAGDRVYRFALRVENEQEIVELRSWTYQTEQHERIEHTWHVDLNTWHAEWNMNEPLEFFIANRWPWIPAYFPLTHQIMGLDQALSLSGLQWRDVSKVMYESWTIEPKAKALSRWIQADYATTWTTRQPGKFFTIAGHEGKVYETDTKSGLTQLLPFGETKNYIDLLHADDRLIILKRHQQSKLDVVEGKELTISRSSPGAGQVDWSYDEWRPIYDLRQGKLLKWPPGLETNLLFEDFMVVDSHDSSRLLYYSDRGQAGLPSIFLLMSLLNGELKLIATWKNDAIHYFMLPQFNGQLIATVNEIVITPEYLQWIPKMDWIQDIIFWLIPEDRNSVALIDESTGKVLWRRQDRVILNETGILTRMNRDILLLTHDSIDQATQAPLKELECWSLPIVIYSAWWARGTGLIMMALILLAMMKRRSRSQLLMQPKG